MSSSPRPSRRLLVLGFASAALTLFALGCTPTYPDCDNDEHCRAKGEYCVGGKCQQCRTADQCGPCNTCNAGACAVVPGCCAQDRDCSVGQACRQGRCGPECLDATECGEGAKCSSGRCVPDVECTSAGDCAAGASCEAGRCVEAPPETTSCDLDRVLFAFDSAEISSGAGRTLQANARCLKDKGDPAITVEGHCDDRGTEEYNLALGERRARSAKRFLENLGASGMRVVSYGENRPVNSPARGEAEQAENRRAEFVAR